MSALPPGSRLKSDIGLCPKCAHVRTHATAAKPNGYVRPRRLHPRQHFKPADAGQRERRSDNRLEPEAVRSVSLSSQNQIETRGVELPPDGLLKQAIRINYTCSYQTRSYQHDNSIPQSLFSNPRGCRIVLHSFPVTPFHRTEFEKFVRLGRGSCRLFDFNLMFLSCSFIGVASRICDRNC